MIKTTEENGGILGVDNTPTKAVASGIWGLNSVFDARSGGIWPVGSLYDYPIENSLRFDGSSYLSKTPTTSNRRTFTFSHWFKRASLTPNDDYDVVFGAGVWSTNNHFSAFNLTTYIGSSIYDSFNVSTGVYAASTETDLCAEDSLRDTSSWYHIVYKIDTTQATTDDRISVYINGVRVPSTRYIGFAGRSTTITQNYDFAFNNAVAHYIGGGISAQYGGVTGFNGYLANIQFIDGQALDPYFFGESKNGVWIPYNAFSTAGSGTATASDGDTATDSYGTNGFHLTFEDGIETLSVNGSNVSAFRDKSGNSNHWKIN